MMTWYQQDMAFAQHKRHWVGARCCLVLLLLFSGSGIGTTGFASTDNENGSTQEIRQETRELLSALKNYTASQRDEAIEKIKIALHNLDRRIETMEREMAENWNKMDQATREKLQSSLQALREQRILVAEYYGSLKSGSAAAWGHIKEGFSSAYRALHDAWEKTEKQADEEK